MDETSFRRECDRALDALKQSLFRNEEEGGYEVEEKNGVLNILFEDNARFVFTPNTPVRQIWISAQTTSFKLDWQENGQAFVLPKSGEDLRTLTERLLRETLGDDAITLR